MVRPIGSQQETMHSIILLAVILIKAVLVKLLVFACRVRRAAKLHLFGKFITPTTTGYFCSID